MKAPARIQASDRRASRPAYLETTARPPIAATLSRVEWQTWVVLAATLGFAILMSWALLAQHRAFNSNGWDLAWFDQIVWNTAHGRPFENSFAAWNFLGEHVEPIL